MMPAAAHPPAHPNRPHAARYHGLAMALHWLTLALLVAVYASMELREAYPKGSDPREALKALHFMLGLSVGLATALRLWVRATHAVPRITPPPGAWEARAAAAMHVLLYAWLIAMPLLGWGVLSAEGKAVPFFGLALPALLPPDAASGEALEELHESLGEAGYFLIGLHAAAALYHHLIRRDDTLRRMLPRAMKG